MNKKIEFSYEGKDYTLEYDRKSVKLMEAKGLEISKFQDKPISMIEILWEGSFLKNHKNLTSSKIDEIYENMSNKSDLNTALISMFSETYASLIGDNEDDDNSKKVEWKMA